MTELTDSQRQAVTTDSRDVLVIAGAGSGKTRVLTERIKHLLTNCGASASDMLVLTFTRKAAAEMQSRLLATLGEGAERQLRGMLIGTFHSIALHILRAEGEVLGYNAKSITILDPDDADLLLKQCCSDLGYLHGKKWKGVTWKAVQAAREGRYHIGVACPEGASDPIRRILAEYDRQMFALNVMDFGKILSECHRLLHEHPEVLERWRQRIKHVLVDELQDTDEVQYRLHGFFAPPATFFGVGDRRQSIYGFRGSRPDLMTEQHPDAEIIDLRECFRCGDRIIKAANSLIGHNDDTLAQPMIGATGRIGDVVPMPGRSANISEIIGEEHTGLADTYR